MKRTKKKYPCNKVSGLQYCFGLQWLIVWTKTNLLSSNDTTVHFALYIKCVVCLGVLPTERGPDQWPEWSCRPQPTRRECGKGFLHGPVPSPQTSQRGWHGQTGPAGYFGLWSGDNDSSLNCIEMLLSGYVYINPDTLRQRFCPVEKLDFWRLSRQ